MTLIAVLLALGAERLLGQFPAWAKPWLLRGYFDAARVLLGGTALWRHALLAPLLVLPPAWLTFELFSHLGNPFVAILLSALVLLLCLGPRDLADDVHDLLDARAQGDAAREARLSRALQRGPEPDEGQRSLTGALFIQSHERLFGILLWFFALGPTGAVLYRIASRLPRYLHEEGATPAGDGADLLHGLLAWIPARITALLFGLAGSLDDALKNWARLREATGHGWRSRTWAVLAEAAGGALQSESDDGAVLVPPSLDAALHEVLSLQSRALLILLAFFAFFATGSWIR